jgi:hypothetical protein
MSNPINCYYLRSRDLPTEDSASEPEADPESEDSLGLSDLEVDLITTEEVIMAMPQISISPFHGNPGERADEWLVWFNNFADVHGHNADKRCKMLPFYLRDHAVAWFSSLQADTKGNYESLTAALKDRFNGSDGLDTNMALLSLQQQHGESCAHYFTRILKVTNGQSYSEDLLCSVAIKGLSGQVKAIVMPQNVKTLEELRKAATLAERTIAATSGSINAASNFPNIVGQQLEKISQRLEAIELRGQESEMPKPTWSRTRGLRDRQRQNDDKIACKRCEGKFSHSLQDCPAFGKICLFCNGRNHFSETCYKRKNEDKLKNQQ